ncbi:MAG: OsmC family protein [Alphaproteobacteria bacterium]
MTKAREHRYQVGIVWTGAEHGPAREYNTYSREHRIEIAGKPPIPGSADPAFRGDGERHNPEEMMIAAISSCHMLWYLHLCTASGVVVTSYTDAAEGTMIEEPGNGRFTEIVLRPTVTIAGGSKPKLAEALHQPAHAECFIANSVNFPVRCEPTIVIQVAE